MKNEKFLQTMSGLDEKFIREANRDVNAWLNSMEGEAVVVDKVKKASPLKITASAVCTAAALFGVFVLAKNVISLGAAEISAGSGRPAEISASSDVPVTKNFFGGEGDLKAYDGGGYYYLYDNSSIYSRFNNSTLLKYNKKTNTLSVACDDPACEHDIFSTGCKAQMKYCVFNGDLIKINNKRAWDSDSSQGGLYLCGESEKQVYKNTLPEGVDSEQKDDSIGVVYPLGNDYLVLFNGGYFYILDTDFNIAYTVIGTGTYSGGVYYWGNEIYYIDDQYLLRKLDMESGESSPVDLGGMNIWEGDVKDNVLWFNNGEAEIYSYDFRTGEIKKHIEHGVAPIYVGKYIQYSYSDGLHYYDPKSGETIEWAKGNSRAFFFDGIYYIYDDNSRTLTLYEEDLTTVINSYVLG